LCVVSAAFCAADPDVVLVQKTHGSFVRIDYVYSAGPTLKPVAAEGVNEACARKNLYSM